MNAHDIIRAWCASCGMPRPSNGDCIALVAALASRSTEPGGEAVSREDFDRLVADMERAKKLLVDVHQNLRNGAHADHVCDLIEKRTGSWFVWGHDRDGSTPPPISASEEAAPAGDGVTLLHLMERAMNEPRQAPTVEDMCARIKAADDAAADGGYMLDSNDCISVLRGTWKGPLANDCPPAPAQAPEPSSAVKASDLDDLREGLGQIAVRVRDNATMLRCCRLIDEALAKSEPRAPVLTADPALVNSIIRDVAELDNAPCDTGELVVSANDLRVILQRWLAASTAQPPATKGVEA